MTFKMNKTQIIVLSVIGVLILGVAAYFGIKHFWFADKVVLVTTYGCPDDSQYTVIREKDSDEAIISGQNFSRIGESEPARFGNGGSLEFLISADTLVLTDTATNESVATCTAKVPEINFVKTTN